MVNVGANPAQASAFSDEQIAQLRSLISAAVHSERVGSQQPPIPAASSLLSPASPQRQPPSTAIQTRPPPGPIDLNNASTGAEQLQHGVAQFPALGPSPLSANLLGTPGTSALAHNLPPLPQKIQQRIIKREYIDFADLLSDNLYPHPSLAAQNQFKLEVNAQDPSSLAFVPSHQRKRKVDGIHSWLEAWNIYLRTVLHHFPLLAPDLLAYQDQIWISTVVSAVAPTANSFTSAVTKVVAAPIPVLSAQKEYCNNLSSSLSHLPPSTPVCIPNLAQELKHYPDRQFASDLLHDLQFGCRIGYQGPRHHRITPNLKSTLLHPEAVTEALQKELSRGHTAGPFSSLPLPTLQCSPLGVVPKKDGSWRIIMDLSSPRGSSINDFISKEDYTLHYASFDQALSLVASFGTGALMAKLDLKHAFRLCPVSPMDRDLLGMHWQGKFYVDLRLPFGLRSSPFLFNRLADAFEWILKNNYAISALMHYLDDYFTVGRPLSPSCASQVQTMVKTADRLGIPLAPDKLEGPTTQLVFLGILIDSNLMECSLPPDKLSELLAELQAWSSCKKCIKRELLSLIGKLNFACRIIPAGRIFLRRLIDLSITARLPHHHISLNVEARRDVAWWLKFLPLWNGRAIIPDPFWSRSPDLELFTDASGGLGFGIYFQGHWLNGSWPPNLADRSIQWKELYPIALACLLWGPLWRGKKLLFHCDNQSVVDIWAKGSSHAPLPPTRPSGRLGSDGSSPLSQDPLDGRLAFLQSQAIAPSTCRAYQAGIRRYSTFCYSRQWDPFPASELQLRYFASWLSDQVSFPTIKLYLAGIRYAHIENRLTDLFADAPLLHLLLRGIKRTNGLSSRCRLPITMSVMRQLKGALSADPQFASQDKLMLWSAFTLAFFGFLRSSEFTSPSSTYFNSLVHLSHSDISFTSDGSLTMQLKSSKTDPFRKGCSIKLAPSGRSVCAVRAMHRYLAHQPSRSATPLYLFSTGQFLTRDKVTSILRILLQRLGFATERYASHSFRIGAATTAAEAGLPPWLIQTLGRWSSNCYTQYIRTPASILQSVPAQLATTQSSPLQSWDPSTGQCRPL
ncbi:hypothetical protein ACROYT_G028176 [Oculina patagonica]